MDPPPRSNRRIDHDNGEHLPDGEALAHGHEHAYWPFRNLARGRPVAEMRELVTGGADHPAPEAKAIVERLRDTLKRLDDLDEFSGFARQAVLGNVDALGAGRDWLGRRLLEHGDFSRHDTEFHQPASAVHRQGLLVAQPWMSPSALLDLAIGVAFISSQEDRQPALEMVKGHIQSVGRIVAATMTVVPEIPRGLDPRKRFGQFLERLVDFGRFDDLRLDLADCLGELLHALGRPGGALAGATRGAELEIDDNTDRIDSGAPNPVCTGARLTLTAKAGESFVERSDVGVAFAPCGQLGIDVTWSTASVSVTVPERAKTGPVYFARRDQTGGSAPGSGDSAGVLGNCPFLGGGATSSLMAGAMQSPLGNARCFLPLGRGLPIAVNKAAAIWTFSAVDRNGSSYSGMSRPAPTDEVILQWEVTSDAALSPTVQLFRDGVLIAQNLPLRAKHIVPPPQVDGIYTLEVTSGCGIVRQQLAVRVLRLLSFEPSDISVGEQQIATFNLHVDRPAAADTVIFLTSVPAHPTTPGAVTIPAGQTQVAVSYATLQAGAPGEPALTAIAYAPGHASASARAWVAAPLGTHEVVADQAGTGALAAIDVVGVHAVLMPTGSVLLFAYDESPSLYTDVHTGKSALWNPQNNEVQAIRMSRNLFCAGHAFLGDGRLLVAGGQSTAISVGGWVGSLFGFQGSGADHDLHLFAGSSWTRVLPDMPGARWYPTCMTLPDGRVLIVSGFSAHAYSTLNADYEIFDGTTNSIARKSGFAALLPFSHEFDLYPFLQVLPGRNLFVHSHETSWLLALNGSSEPVISGLGYTPYYNGRSPNSRTYPGQGACVMLPLDPDQPTRASILVIGGGGAVDGGLSSNTPADNTAEIFEFDSSLPLDEQAQWRFTGERGPTPSQTFLTQARIMADAVLLPDGTVAVIGGAGSGKADAAWPPIMWIESFDPATETFSRRAGMSVARLYHSTSLLLPDGSVMIAGSTGWRWDQSISGGSDNEFRIEIYYPPYLFRGPRPTFRLAGTSLQYGQQLSIEVPTGTGPVVKVAAIRHGSTTHTNNMDQRYVGLKITSRSATQLEVTLPPDAAIAPPGPYMLFVVAADANNELVPSIGTLVNLG